MSGTLFDPGLQPERTELAWRRTILSITLGAVVALRILPTTLGTWSIGAALIGLALAALLWILAHRRARYTRQTLLHGHGQLPGGGLLLLLCTLISGGSALGLLYVVLA